MWQNCFPYLGDIIDTLLINAKTWKKHFFVRKTHENNWSRVVLLNFISTDLYEREGKAINNFELALPDANKDLAKQITKDPYNFDFLLSPTNIMKKNSKMP